MPTTPTPLHITPTSVPPPPRFAIAGDIYTLLLTGEQTSGAFMLIDALVFPGGGPPPHTHTREDETFIVLDGELTVMADGRTFTASPGEAVHIPRGTPHTFHNHTDRRARMLFQCNPAGIEKMFLELGARLAPDAPADAPPARATPEEIQKMLSASPRYGITIHLPPP